MFKSKKIMVFVLSGLMAAGILGSNVTYASPANPHAGFIADHQGPPAPHHHHHHHHHHPQGPRF